MEVMHKHRGSEENHCRRHIGRDLDEDELLGNGMIRRHNNAPWLQKVGNTLQDNGKRLPNCERKWGFDTRPS